MKRILLVFTSAAFLVACNTTPSTDTASFSVSPAKQEHAVTVDTTGFARFQQWKAQQELAALQENNLPVEQEVAAAPVKKVRKASAAPVRRTANTASAPSRNNSNSSTVPDNSEDVAMSSESANEAKVEEKKGWSKAAKGAAIGAGTGAVVGAVVSKKNRVMGGVIGGVVGGAVGYGVGKVLDKKDGRN